MTELLYTKKDVIKTNISLDEYKQQADSHAESVAKALEESVSAGNAASKTQNDLIKSLTAVETLMVEIESLEAIDFETLKSAEERFGEAKNTIESNITISIELLESKLVEQKATITNYELELDPLRKQIAAVNVLFETIPKRCLKSETLFEKAIPPKAGTP